MAGQLGDLPVKKHLEVAEGRIHMTHDLLWRYAGSIETGDHARNWSARTWTLWGLRWRAKVAEKRIAVPVNWVVHLPPAKRWWTTSGGKR